jgi:parallel beta-helix repeat protein
MMFVLEKPKLLALVGFLMFYSLPSQAATINVACPGQSLQTALEGAQPGDTIQVSGTCTENVLVRNEKQRIAIQGTGVNPTINGPDTSQPTINVRGKGIVIQGFIIGGGRSGIHVNRGSNAVIDGNDIDSSLFGIQVDQQSFAVITGNTITGNSVGIHVDESSTVRVGYNLATDISASPNTITQNNYGIWIDGNSNAKIAGNTISGSANEGILLRQQAHAIIAGNNIGNNNTGIRIEQKSSVDLSDTFAGPLFLDSPNNSNAGNNFFVGLICNPNGGYASGPLGSLTGNSAQKSITSPCMDNTF